MKKATHWLLGGVLALCLHLPSYAQNSSSFVKFFITITDPAYEPTVTYGQNEVIVSFTQSTVNDIANDYSFNRFHRAYPNTSNTALEDVFIVEANSAQCMYDLKAHNSTIFANAGFASFQTSLITITDPAYVPTTSVVNNQTTISFTQAALNTIAADYIVERFEQAFPQSTNSNQQKVYVVTVQNQAFLPALNNYNATVFTGITSYVPKRFSIYITNDSYAAYGYMNLNGQQFFSSSNAGVQAILNNYLITDFHQAYPSSRLEHLRQIYKVETNSAQLMQDLINHNSYVFPSGKIDSGTIVPTYTPIDYGKAFGAVDTTQKYLDLIEAKDAWDYFALRANPLPIGDSNILIGIIDWYFDDNHPDIKGNIKKVYGVNHPNTLGSISPTHGISVAGTAAGSTDNGTVQNPVGQSSIGFNCKLALYPHDSIGRDYEQHALKLSKDGVPIINLSLVAGAFPNNARHAGADFTKNQQYVVGVLNEDIYNEIYENGATAVCAAGNGGDYAVAGGNVYDNGSYLYPASFDHNISVTSVGSDWATYHPSTGPLSIIDHHLRSYQGGNHVGNSHNHNRRVDICAPGYTVHTLSYDPNGTPVHSYARNTAGSSIAAPLVSGTIGLMLSAKPCLSPYQREYILKKSVSKALYSIPDNAPFTTPNLLGTGRLDADSAVRMAGAYSCNNPATKTMYIEDVKITHKCAVWVANLDKAQLSVVVKNGNGNYDYRWRRISNNTCILDDEYSATPKVISSNPTSGNPHIFYFLLTVTEKGKEIPQVANKRVQINMSGEAEWDLAIRDAFMDMYNEPNNMDTVDRRDWNFWLSPDLWNRQAKSTPINTTHEHPEYFNTDSNYLYVRVKNVGCSYYPGSPAMANPSEVKTYWTKASTGEKWKDDWDGTTMVLGANGNQIVAGGEIPTKAPQIVTSQLLPGQEQMFIIPWRPPNPVDYDSSINQVEVCVLARILDKSKPNDGLVETFGNVFPNVRNNNNIATRNLIVTNFNPLNKLTDTRQIDVVNVSSSTNTFRLQLINDKNINKHYSGDLSEYMHAVVHLGALYDIWVAGGSLGTAVDVNAANKTATFDFSTPLNFDNLSLPAGTRYPVNIELKLNSGVTVPFDVTDGFLHFRQIEMDGAQEKRLQGNVSIAISIDKSPSGSKQAQTQETLEAIVSKANLVKAYPNPASEAVSFEYKVSEDNDQLVLTITNITGQIVKQVKLSQPSGVYKWQTQHNLSGVYIYKLSNGNQQIDIGRIVIAK